LVYGIDEINLPGFDNYQPDESEPGLSAKQQISKILKSLFLFQKKIPIIAIRFLRVKNRF